MSFQATPGIFEFTQQWREGLVRRKQVREADGLYRSAPCSCASPPRGGANCERARGWGVPDSVNHDGLNEVSGIRVEQRRADVGDGSSVIRFAPEHGCEQMERVETRYQFGLPVARQSNTVTRVKFG